mgnify:CR=1 FL=1
MCCHACCQGCRHVSLRVLPGCVSHKGVVLSMPLLMRPLLLAVCMQTDCCCKHSCSMAWSTSACLYDLSLFLTRGHFLIRGHCSTTPWAASRQGSAVLHSQGSWFVPAGLFALLVRWGPLCVHSASHVRCTACAFRIEPLSGKPCTISRYFQILTCCVSSVWCYSMSHSQ